MADLFKAGDIVRAAEEIEIRGEDFYRRLVASSEDEEARRLFHWLMEEEMTHRAVFSAMGERLAPVELPAWADESDYLMYMRSLLDSHALFRPDAVPAEQLGRDEAVRLAMQFEKDTMLFFAEMRDFVPEAERKHIDNCIAEERKHLKQLMAMLRK
ncbi:ferritin-like domain-containing protein [Oleidesulfovibrio sp.]|uniref:ferritin-like domain-containing protein n=1 Tax=Oleidesulfovibrio sp. TaxID=2909707 RepID=UPI003A85BC9C